MTERLTRVRALALALCVSAIGFGPGLVAAQETASPGTAQTETGQSGTGQAGQEQVAPAGNAADAAPADTAPATAVAPAAASPATTAPATTAPAALPNERNAAETDGSGVDYTAWAGVTARADAILADQTTPDDRLVAIRAELVKWRGIFVDAESANSTRIETVRTQIGALGAAPAEGQTEPDEIAQRRKLLNDQLARLQAPSLAAQEAYTHADGLIREIDRVQRERQTNALLKLGPSPLNPSNWAEGLSAVHTFVMTLASEVRLRLAWPSSRSAMQGNMPLILLSVALGVALIWRGRPLIERLSQRLMEGASRRGRGLGSFVVSLGQIIIPTLGVVAFSTAIWLTSLPGPVGNAIVAALPAMGFVIFAAIWLGGQIFPKSESAQSIPSLDATRRTEGRYLTAFIGMVLAAELLRDVAMKQMSASTEAVSVISFPIIALLSLLVWRIGKLLRAHLRNASDGDEAVGFRNRILGMLGSVAIGIGYVAPVLAAIGYVAAASALVFPAAASLGLIALLFIAQRIVAEVYVLVSGGDDTAQDALVPVLVGFVLIVAALPLFALLWGARLVDLLEMWNRFLDGVQFGGTQISPTNFMIFVLIFAVGYTITRFVQGAMKTTILPRTKLDAGGQNAAISGLGYIGIFLSGLVAINSAGINLTGLAMLASALSVGLGFGLQNIVSNFVSGVIVLIERPISEGDWIEVGGTQGIVKAISVRSTRIQTFDRTDVIVPNSTLLQQNVTNWTRFSLAGRLTVPVGVAYGSDTRKVEQILREIAEAQPLAILNPPPFVSFVGYGADAINFSILVVLRDVNAIGRVRNEINHQIGERFAAEGIDMPFAQRDIWLRNPEAIREAFGSDTEGGAHRAEVSGDGTTA